MTTKTQKKPSKKSSKDTKKTNNEKPLRLNLVHCLFIHAMLSDLYADSIDDKFKGFLIDIIALHESLIEDSDNEKLKEKMKYQPFKFPTNETT